MNTFLADEVVAQIEAHPETHQQAQWRCETGMCLAGWASTLAGYQWLTTSSDRMNTMRDYVIVPNGYAGDDMHSESFRYLVDSREAIADGIYCSPGDTATIAELLAAWDENVSVSHVQRVASTLLELDTDQADELFYGGNTLESIKDVLKNISNGEL